MTCKDCIYKGICVWTKVEAKDMKKCKNFKNKADFVEKAEFEKLTVELIGMRGACESYKMHYEKAQAEIKQAKSEAIKEFADKLILDVQRHLIPDNDNGTVTVENAERYFISRIKALKKDFKE